MPELKRCCSMLASIGIVLLLIIFAMFMITLPVTAHGDGILPDGYPDAELINQGRKLFFEEDFDGNGRTCGSCHPESNNFTLDPRFIATMSAGDPLFIAERPEPNALNENFEKPALMHQTALILENTNGFGDLDNEFTMRSVPHLKALRTTITPPSPTADDGTLEAGSPAPPEDRTGWGGDGAPLQGTVRDFTIGAIKQHFTKTLDREPGIDFRLPTDEELDALEAFMLSLGRQQPADDINSYTMRDSKAERGRLNYMGVGLANGIPCNACHFNGGANTDPGFAFPPSVSPPAFEFSNRSFVPRGEELLDQHADIVDEASNPPDDGFGHGTGLFNVPPVIEAADTGPFFHNNAIDTVEGMVSFYATQRHLKDGEILPPIVGLNGAQVVNVAAFVRVLNADENARSAIRLLEQAGQVDNRKDRKVNLDIAVSEMRDAIEVLQGGNLHFSDAVPSLRSAVLSARLRRFDKAINQLQQARDSMIER